MSGLYTDCIEWTGAKAGNGYGTVWMAGRMAYAHRVAWEKENGPIPSGMCVLHLCDNPPCTNPAHLFLGTQRDNVADMLSKGRGRWAGTPGTCYRGHPRNEENTYVSPGGERKCRVCGRENKRKERAS